MKIKVTIKVLGRIGTLAFRRMIEDVNFEIFAINDIAPADNLSYQLKYDTTY